MVDLQQQNVEIVALISQIELGNYDTLDPRYAQDRYADFLSPESALRCSEDVLLQISVAHSNLHGISPDTAKYRFLQTIAGLSSYGVQHHDARSCNGLPVHIAIGPEGIVIFDEQWNETSRYNLFLFVLLKVNCIRYYLLKIAFNSIALYTVSILFWFLAGLGFHLIW